MRVFRHGKAQIRNGRAGGRERRHKAGRKHAHALRERYRTQQKKPLYVPDSHDHFRHHPKGNDRTRLRGVLDRRPVFKGGSFVRQSHRGWG